MEEEKTEIKKKKKFVNVRVIYSKGDTSMVEWIDKNNFIHRAFIPSKEVSNSTVDEDVLDAGVPYGVMWEDCLPTIEVKPDVIANALRTAGIWTSHDLWSNPQQAIGAIQSITLDLGVLLKAANKYEREVK